MGRLPAGSEHDEAPSAGEAARADAMLGVAPEAAAVLALQRSVGNRAVGALLRSRRLAREPAEPAPSAGATWVETDHSAISASLANWSAIYGAIEKLPPDTVIIIPTASSGAVGVVKGERFEDSRFFTRGGPFVPEPGSTSEIFRRDPLRPAASPLETVHVVLDVAGMAPGVGEVADVVNAVFYFAEGDTGNAVVSMMAMLPVGGSAATGSRLAKRAAGSWNEALEAAYNIEKRMPTENLGVVFRGTSQRFSPDVLKAKGGMQPRGHDTDLYEFLEGNEESYFVSTSRDAGEAIKFAQKKPGGGYLYDIDPSSGRGIDARDLFGGPEYADMAAIAEKEVSFPGGVFWDEIRGYRRVNPDGSLGDFVRNPDYRAPER